MRRVLLNSPARLLGSANAIISTTSVPYVVESFPGPLSIKWMASGWGVWETDAGRYRVDPDCYLVLNRGRVYSLVVETDEPRETFCPFFATGFVEDAQRALSGPAIALLDDPPGACRSATMFPEHLEPADGRVTPQLRRMYDGVRRGIATDGWLEDQFHVLAERVLLAWRHTREQIARVPAVRAATREELYRRLCRARDHVHACFAEPLTLAAVATEACLAPHHFHRLFRQVFGRTPHEYLVELRMARARTLLRATDRPVTDVCLDVGFESVGSFSTLFRREVGMSPSQFRRCAHDN